jgi:predicted dehydrogenase
MLRPNKTIRLGIIGCGRVAEERHLPALLHIRNIDIIAVSDVNESRMNSLADRVECKNRWTDYRDLLNCSDVEAVGILTPTQTHAEIGLAALNAGMDVLIEKPLAMNVKECDSLIKKASHSSCKVVVGFNLRWHRLVQRARAFIRIGAMGRIKAIRSVYTHDRLGDDAPDWHRKLKLGGGVLFNEAVHHFDLWRYLLDMEVDQIFSLSRPSVHYEDETNTLAASLSDGVLATGVFTLRSGVNSEVEIYGEEGRLYLSCYQFDGLKFYSHSTYPGDLVDRMKKAAAALRELPQSVYIQRRGGDFAATFFSMWQHFADCILNDQPSACTLEDGKQAIRVALAAINSASSGKPVVLMA